MNRAPKIMSLIFLITYIFTVFSSNYFHSHEEKHEESANKFTLHSHYVDNDSHSNDFQELHFTNNHYFDDNHNLSITVIQNFLTSTSFFSANFYLTKINRHTHLIRFATGAIKPSEDRCVLSAANASPPAV